MERVKSSLTHFEQFYFVDVSMHLYLCLYFSTNVLQILILKHRICIVDIMYVPWATPPKAGFEYEQVHREAWAQIISTYYTYVTLYTQRRTPIQCTLYVQTEKVFPMAWAHNFPFRFVLELYDIRIFTYRRLILVCLSVYVCEMNLHLNWFSAQHRPAYTWECSFIVYTR